MKKLILLTVLIFSLFSTAAFAAENSAAPANGVLHRSLETIGVVVIGGADVKTPDFFNAIAEAFSPTAQEAQKYTIETGTPAQTKYQNYWSDKNFLDEQPLTKDVAVDFVKYSGYDKVLYIMISQPVMENTLHGGGFWGYWDTTTHNRASIEVKAYLSDGNTILKSVNVTKEDDSAASQLRAKRGAFKKSIKEIAAQVKDALI